MLAGCSGDAGETLGSSETEQRLKMVVRTGGSFMSAHRGQNAESVQQVKDWIATLPEEQRKLMPPDMESIWTSPRDNQPFEVNFKNLSGPPAMGAPSERKDPIVAHEKNGEGGKRYVVYNNGRTDLLDEDEFADAAN